MALTVQTHKRNGKAANHPVRPTQAHLLGQLRPWGMISNRIPWMRDYTTTGIKKLPQELNLIPVVVVIPKALPSGITTTIGIKL